MHSVFSVTRPVVSCLLLGSLSLPAQPGIKAPLFDAAAASERTEEPLPQPGTPATSASDDNGLHLVVLAGDHGINSLKNKSAVHPMVRVLDGRDRPVADALVTFSVPADGPSVEFESGSRTTMLVSDSDGRVTVARLTPVNAGPFLYRVRALYQQQEATGTVSQTNVPDASTANVQAGQTAVPTAAPKHHVPSWAYLALVGGAAAGAGIGLALGNRASSHTTQGSNSAAIGAPGTPVVGAGH